MLFHEEVLIKLGDCLICTCNDFLSELISTVFLILTQLYGYPKVTLFLYLLCDAV